MEEVQRWYRSSSIETQEEAGSHHFADDSQDNTSRRSSSEQYIQPSALLYNTGHRSPTPESAIPTPDHSEFFTASFSPLSPAPDDIHSTPSLPAPASSTRGILRSSRFFPRRRSAQESQDQQSFEDPKSDSSPSPPLYPARAVGDEPTHLSDTEYKPASPRPQRRRGKPSIRNPKSGSSRSSRSSALRASEIETIPLSNVERNTTPSSSRPRRGPPLYRKLPPPNATREELEKWHQNKIERLEEEHQSYLDQHTRGEVMALSKREREIHDKERDARMSRLRRARKNYDAFKGGMRERGIRQELDRRSRDRRDRDRRSEDWDLEKR